jgi:hypothetical protein
MRAGGMNRPAYTSFDYHTPTTSGLHQSKRASAASRPVHLLRLRDS